MPLFNDFKDACSMFAWRGPGWPRQDLDYPIYGVHVLADEGAFTSVVVLSPPVFLLGFAKARI